MILGIVSASPCEAKTLLRTEPVIGKVYSLGQNAFLAVAGAGEVSARTAAESLLAKGAGALLSWGVAAGLQPGLMSGAILLPKLLVIEGGGYEVSRSWHTAIKKRLSHYAQVHEGPLTHSHFLLSGPESKQALHNSSAAVAVDRESAAIAAVAKKAKVPFLILRVVADPAETRLPAALSTQQNNDLSPSGLLATLGPKPWRWAALLKLRRCLRRALTALQGVGESLQWDFEPPRQSSSRPARRPAATESGQ